MLGCRRRVHGAGALRVRARVYGFHEYRLNTQHRATAPCPVKGHDLLRCRQRRHCPASAASRPFGRSSLPRLNGSRANPSGGARTRFRQNRAPSRAHGQALPWLAAPGLGTSSTGSRCQDHPDRASWPRHAPLEQPRCLGRVAARARSAQRRLPSGRRRRSGETVGQTGCRLAPGCAQRCWKVGRGLTRVRRLGPAGGWPAPSTLSCRRVVRPRPSSARRGCRSTGVRGGKSGSAAS